jgi:hypothetical protein
MFIFGVIPFTEVREFVKNNYQKFFELSFGLFYFVSGLKLTLKTMVQVQNIIRQNIASVWVPVLNRSEQPCFKASAGPDRGSSHILSPLDYIEAIQEGGIKQSNLFSVSAGNDLRMSTMRPNPYLSAGIEERRDYRGLLLFNSRSK